ncbi:putative lipoprotein [Leptospira interrogans str. HAI1594]|nr:Putative lipoprotein [Leptospira interrogans serovar Copenhageni/Icterohaemorrhagiae]EKP74496.1 putative lipoprotein [Leptospira interrogans str. HAI1594]EMN66501.1 putative lipoprotein [Leptospira interrogans serovar Grippotyphosa str. UI 08434]EMO18607.1 putative lipoprotein [Leptospira interrogans serovar Copenhageni str. HAI0188]EMY52828.1 lipoprotein, tandem type [Leptospira interrogans serovar Copenhageni str. M20]KPA26600.1 putative lipoprotein [Leptospira interrogans]QIP62873.1 hyp
MEKNYKKLIFLMIVVIGLTGCKKSQEELAKEEEKKKLEVVNSSINMVYGIFINNLVFLLDENAESMKEEPACFEFRPKEGRASVKFYKHPEVYNLEVKTKNELEYILIYQAKQANLKLNLKGQLPGRVSGVIDVLSAELRLFDLPNKKKSAAINDIDIAYDGQGDSNSDSHHGRFNSISECEEGYVKNDELNESLREQKSTCEGPGC